MAERSILLWLAIGLAVALLTLLVSRGRLTATIATALVGMAGALLGGFAARAGGLFHNSTIDAVAAGLGAAILILAYRAVLRRRG